MPISPEFVERYQLEYEKNPKSRIFAPLAEAYRQMELLDEAFRICSNGVQLHPEFAGGRVAFARILIARGEREKALTQLEKAIQLSPDNLMAHSLLGETLLELRRPKDALKAFKMVLFLNPSDERALKTVRKWEFLSAEEYDEELFKMRPVFEAPAPPMLQPMSDAEASFQLRPSRLPQLDNPAWRSREIERAISLADAFTVRAELEKAIQVLQDARRQLGSDPELDRRLSLLARRTQAMEDAELEGEAVDTATAEASPLSATATSTAPAMPPSSSGLQHVVPGRARAVRRARLELLLQRISERRIN